MEGLVTDELRNTFAGKRVLVTGHTGFKGSWLCLWLSELNAEVFGYALEPQSEEDNFVVSNVQSRLQHIIGDVRDHRKLESVPIQRGDPPSTGLKAKYVSPSERTNSRYDRITSLGQDRRSDSGYGASLPGDRPACRLKCREVSFGSFV